MTYFRKLTEQDYKDILDISKDIWEGTDYLPEVFYDWVKAPGLFVGAVDEAKNKIVAVGKYSILHDGSGWLEGLRVHKDFRGLKLGRDMSEYLLNIAKEELEKGNIETIRFSTHASSSGSINIMTKLNFKVSHQFVIVSKDFAKVDGSLSLEDFTVEPWNLSSDEFIELVCWKRRKNIVPLSFVFQRPTEELYEELKASHSLLIINGCKGIFKFKGEIDFITLDDNIEAIETFMNYFLLKYNGKINVMSSILPEDAILISKLKAADFDSWYDWKPDYLCFEYNPAL